MEKETLIDKITKVVTIAGNFIMMNLLFLLAALPIVTMGQAWSGLMSAIRYNIRGDKWLDGFKAGFKDRFWRGLVSWLIMLLLTGIMLFDVMTNTGIDTVTPDLIVRLIMSCIMFTLMAALTVALILLNVYIPTATGNWIRTAVNMVFKAPIQLMVCGIIIWLPLLLAIFSFGIFYYGVMVFIAVYFTLAALGITFLMKQTLIYYLLEARAEGIILDDGSQTTQEDDEEDGEG